MLDPRSDDDRRITAFTRSFAIKTFPNGDVWQGTWSYDCWGDKQGGLFEQRVTAEYSKKITGQKGSPSLHLTKRGCCPPQLAKDFIMKEGAPVERDPVEEAMKLHKRGYFGGGG